MSKKIRLVVRSFSDPEYRHVVTGTEDGIPDDSRAEKITLGLLRNIGEDFYVDEEEI